MAGMELRVEATLGQEETSSSRRRTFEHGAALQGSSLHGTAKLGEAGMEKQRLQVQGLAAPGGAQQGIARIGMAGTELHVVARIGIRRRRVA